MKNKFFYFTQKSSCPFHYWVCRDDARDILEPSYLKHFQYSMLHNLLPRNGVPNIASSIEEIQSGECEKFDLSISLPKNSHSKRLGIQYEDGHDPYLQRPLISEHSHYYKFEQSNLLCDSEYRLVERDNDTSLPIQDELTVDLYYGLLCDNQPYGKSMNFIETESSCNEIAGF